MSTLFQFIITKKKSKINSRTITKWKKILYGGGLIDCFHSSDCPVKSQTVEDATEHKNTCELSNAIYCAICNFRSKNRNEVFNHIKQNHGSGDEQKVFESDEESDAYERKSEKSESDSDGSFVEEEEEEDESDIETASEVDLSDIEDQQNQRSRTHVVRHRTTELTNVKHQMLRNMTHDESSRSTSNSLMLL